MLTIERFYFDHDEAGACVVMGADKTDCHIEFISAEEHDGISIRVVVRGREDFRKFINQIHSMGMGLLDGFPESPPSTNAVDPSAQPSGTPTPRDPESSCSAVGGLAPEDVCR